MTTTKSPPEIGQYFQDGKRLVQVVDIAGDEYIDAIDCATDEYLRFPTRELDHGWFRVYRERSPDN